MNEMDGMNGTPRDTVAHSKRRWTGQCEPVTIWGKRLTLALTLLCLAPTVMAQTLSQTELQKLLASDAEATDSFGHSVALSGDRALIGALVSDDAGNDSGSAYVYERDGTGTWVEVAKLTASDAASVDHFGRSVALSGDRALVGAYLDDDAGKDSGSTYVFERDRDGIWVQVAKLSASDAAAGDQFGISVALSEGDRALVGAHEDDDAGNLSGSAYMFERNGKGIWVQVAKLTALDAEAGDFFGNSVALSGNRALVGAVRNDGGGTFSGSAYLFERDGSGMWVQRAKLTASDAAIGEFFGESVALSGDRALVGAILGNNDRGSQTGSAYMFEGDETGMWNQVAKLTALDAEANDRFGHSVALSGNLALIGANMDDDFRVNSGSAYVFERDGAGMWGEVTKLTASDDSTADFFGRSVALSGNLALVGAPFSDDVASDSGSAYVFDIDADRIDSRKYGYRFGGVVRHREAAERLFHASGSDLLLKMTGFDIDTRKEIRVLVNGTEIGFLSRTPNDGRGPSQLTIPARLLIGKNNTLRFEQLNPGWKWGVTDLLLSEIGGKGELESLTLDNVDSGKYGFRFEGTNNHREALERPFNASGSDLMLTLTGFDIDIRQEVRVLINGTQIGFLSRTPNNKRGPTQLRIAQSLLSSTGNTMRIEQLNPGWIWGVTDLLLSNAGQ